RRGRDAGRRARSHRAHQGHDPSLRRHDVGGLSPAHAEPDRAGPPGRRGPGRPGVVPRQDASAVGAAAGAARAPILAATVAALRSVLIANRGEIAVRVARTLRARGIESIAVYHAVDRGAAHVLACDRAVELRGDDPRAAYLNIDGLVRTAKTAGADSIHPG